MFNETNNINLTRNTTNIAFNNPCTGIIQRSHPKSIFVRFAKGSLMENMIFPYDGSIPHMHQFIGWRDQSTDKAKEYADNNFKIEVIVLQVMLFGDNQFLVEIVEPKFLIE